MALRGFSPFRVPVMLPVETPAKYALRLADVLQRNLDDIKVIISQYVDRAPNDYQYLQSVVLVTGSTQNVEHMLGRTVRGYRVTRKTAAGTLHDEIHLAAVDLTKFLPLVVSANCTVDLEVF